MISFAAEALSLKMILIVVVGVFLGSFMDAIAGGGGIITLPTYLLAGLPVHNALATNKLSAGLGTTFSLARFVKNGFINWRLALPAAGLAVIGSALGTKLQLLVPDIYLQYALLVVLPVVAVVVLKQRDLPETDGEISAGKQRLIVWSAAFVVGSYDGFYGPGTGTFLLLIFCNLAKMNVRLASGTTKLVNYGSNIGGIIAGLLSGKVYLVLGLCGAVAAGAGHWFGSGFAIRGGSKIVKPTVIVVLVLLAVKIISGFFTGT